MWKQIVFLLVSFVLVRSSAVQSKKKSEKLAHALDNLDRKEFDLGTGVEIHGDRSFYLIKAMTHLESTGDPLLKDTKPSNNDNVDDQKEEYDKLPKKHEREMKDDKSVQQGRKYLTKGTEKPQNYKKTENSKKDSTKNHLLKRVLVLLSNPRYENV